MFKTFRHRLLFWFLMFIGISIVVIILSIVYLNKREAIASETETIEQAYIQLLQSVESQQYFFAYETKNQYYFQTGNSTYLEHYKVQMDSTKTLLKSVTLKSNPEIRPTVKGLEKEIVQIDSLFLYLTGKVKERGFKDFSLEGKMRQDAHWLEAVDELPKSTVLSLRRHEKDYIIRNEPEYVDKLTRLATTLRDGLQRAGYLDRTRRDSLLHYLNGYEEKFLQMVELDRLIGIKNNTGLKLQLDKKILSSEATFSHVVLQTKNWAKQEFRKLTLLFMLLGLVVLAFSILLSALIARRITNP